MQYAYLDYSGCVDDASQKVSVLGIVCCSDSRLLQLLLKPPHEPPKEIADYFQKKRENTNFMICTEANQEYNDYWKTR